MMIGATCRVADSKRLRHTSAMRTILTSVLLGSALCCAGGPAPAASSQWVETEGARVRLVTTGGPRADGVLWGILDIELEPGWKTYWRDPGDAGVPPSVDISGSANITAARLDFPPPRRHDGGGFQWAGYDHPVALPIAFQVKSPGQPAVISAEIFLGVCETICIPVQATLTVDPASDAENPEDAAAVTAALAALPGPARPDFGIRTVSEPGASTVLLEAVFPGDPQSAELFIAAEEGYVFSPPTRIMRNGKTLFSVAAELPAEPGTGPGLHYTLSTDAGSVGGILPYF
ncbi:MAG: hypothetical protein K0S21_893 [Rhizobiaceae bacterium]|nr:hypothetical protein [Rhizobiaceae bacterium]